MLDKPLGTSACCPRSQQVRQFEVGYAAHMTEVKNPCKLLVRRPEG
jgi:hypothetical protein